MLGLQLKPNIGDGISVINEEAGESEYPELPATKNATNQSTFKVSSDQMVNLENILAGKTLLPPVPPPPPIFGLAFQKMQINLAQDEDAGVSGSGLSSRREPIEVVRSQN